MYFYDKQTKNMKDRYIHLLSMMGALSHLFSTSKIPYLDSRIAENVFCKALEAENIARQDCTADAKKNNIGIGIKTWINSSTLQKIAEFNKAREDYIDLKYEDMIYKIAELRNARINFTKREHGLNDLIYHCITRTENKFIIKESNMEEIDINTIKILSYNKASIKFKDKFNEYSFNLSKSVLMKQFNKMNSFEEINIDILENPYLLLETCFENKTNFMEQHKTETLNTNKFIILPLYKKDQNNIKSIPLKSGLNQWNANGRERNLDEIYIRITKKDHKLTPNFFPNRNIVFKLILPNGKNLNAKICQDNDKALMSNPNKALGKWLLRDILNLKEGTLVTYKLLEELGIDAVKIEKLADNEYKINFAPIGAYEDFIESKTKIN